LNNQYLEQHDPLRVSHVIRVQGIALSLLAILKGRRVVISISFDDILVACLLQVGLLPVFESGW